MAAIGIAIGAFVNGFSNRLFANPGLAMINAAIEHDIDAQNQILIIIGKALKNKGSC